MAALFGIQPPFRIHSGFVQDFVHLKLIDDTRGKLSLLTIFDANHLWQDHEDDVRKVKFSYDPKVDWNPSGNFGCEIHFRPAPNNLYALQMQWEDGESLTYFQVSNLDNPKLTLRVIDDQDQVLHLASHKSFRELSAREMDDRMSVDN